MKYYPFALICYAFPHKRTYDFLYSLFLNNLLPQVILAKTYEKIDKIRSLPQDKFNHIAIEHPKKIACKMNIPYLEGTYLDEKILKYIKENNIKFGIIASALVLPPPFVSAFEEGIINFHPGIIPYNRGLGAVKWAIINNLPQGLTIHKIDYRIDAGTILHRYLIRPSPWFTIRDINLLLHELQILLLPKVVRNALKEKYSKCEPLPSEIPPFHSYPTENIPEDIEKKYFEMWSNNPLLNCFCKGKISNNKCSNCNASFTKINDFLFKINNGKL